MKGEFVSQNKIMEIGNQKIPYTLIKSKRKSYAIRISVEHGVEVRVPLRMSENFLQSMFQEREDWILSRYEEMQEKKKHLMVSPYSPKEKEEIKKRYIKAAREYFPKRVEHFVREIYWEKEELFPETGLPFTGISIREQKTRWGSCSSSGMLSFNWKLMLAPPGILDYVVVHELCHFRHMNHSADFWNMVGEIIPDYKERRKWLAENGIHLHL